MNVAASQYSKTKTMFKFSLLAFAGLFFTCAQVAKIQKTSAKNAIPVLKVISDTSTFELKISKLIINVEVTGNIATTTFDVSFYNSLDRILEGGFEFPLSDGQNVVRYALEVNGKMREGVVVEKVKARIAFENTVRQNIDPGLIEKTKGNKPKCIFWRYG